MSPTTFATLSARPAVSAYLWAEARMATEAEGTPAYVRAQARAQQAVAEMAAALDTYAAPAVVIGVRPEDAARAATILGRPDVAISHALADVAYIGVEDGDIAALNAAGIYVEVIHA